MLPYKFQFLPPCLKLDRPSSPSPPLDIPIWNLPRRPGMPMPPSDRSSQLRTTPCPARPVLKPLLRLMRSYSACAPTEPEPCRDKLVPKAFCTSIPTSRSGNHGFRFSAWRVTAPRCSIELVAVLVEFLPLPVPKPSRSRVASISHRQLLMQYRIPGLNRRPMSSTFDRPC